MNVWCHWITKRLGSQINRLFPPRTNFGKLYLKKHYHIKLLAKFTNGTIIVTSEMIRLFTQNSIYIHLLGMPKNARCACSLVSRNPYSLFVKHTETFSWWGVCCHTKFIPATKWFQMCCHHWERLPEKGSRWKGQKVVTLYRPRRIIYLFPITHFELAFYLGTYTICWTLTSFIFAPVQQYLSGWSVLVWPNVYD